MEALRIVTREAWEEDMPLDEKKKHTVGRVNQKGAADELNQTVHVNRLRQTQIVPT